MMGAEAVCIWERGHKLEGRQPVFVTTPFWQQPDQTMMAEREAGRGCKTGMWHLCIHTRYIGTSAPSQIGILG